MALLLPIMMALSLAGSATYLECQVVDAGAVLADDTPFEIGVVLSLNPRLYHVETRGADFRTSTMGVGATPEEWWWDDWRGGILGRSHLNRTTLAYRVERGGRHSHGRCRKLTEPRWFNAVP